MSKLFFYSPLCIYAGQTIQLYFEVENRVDTSYNSWAYIDDVIIWDFYTQNPASLKPYFVVPEGGNPLNLIFPANNANSGPLNGATVQHQSRYASPAYHYGTYETRAKAASCASGEGLVNAPGFTYWRENIDEVADHSEIDYEIYGTDSDTIDIVIWPKTNRDASKCKQAYRRVNVKTGEIITARECDNIGPNAVCRVNCNTLPEQGQYTNSISDFNTRNFNDYAFNWQSNEIKFTINGVTVWDYTNSYYIPTHTTYFNHQIWHANYAGTSPTSTAIMEVSEASYEPI